MGGGCLRRTGRFSLFSIRLIHLLARPEAFKQASSTGYPAAAKLALCVAWILIGTLSSFLSMSMTLLGTDVVKSGVLGNWPTTRARSGNLQRNFVVVGRSVGPFAGGVRRLQLAIGS